MSRSDLELVTPYAKLMCLALGLVFLGKQDQAEATLEVRVLRGCVWGSGSTCGCVGVGMRMKV